MFLTILAPPQSDRAEFRSMSPAAAVDSLYFAAEPMRSLSLSESFLIEVNDAELRWRAARAAIAVGMLTDARAERLMLYDRALLHARQAVAIQPSSVDARYWLAAAAGRRAHRDDPVYSAKLAVEVHEIVRDILAVDSTHAGAHHALGVLHAEVCRVPALARFVASRVLRVDLAAQASVRQAERHLKRAVELDPQSVPYLADLALFLVRTRRLAEADSVVRRLTAATAKHPTDERMRADVLRLRRSSGYPAAVGWRGRVQDIMESTP